MTIVTRHGSHNGATVNNYNTPYGLFIRFYDLPLFRPGHAVTGIDSLITRKNDMDKIFYDKVVRPSR